MTWLLVAIILLLPLITALPEARGVGRLPFDLRVAGVDVSRMDPGAASLLLSERALAIAATPVELSLGDDRWSVLPEEMGLRVDVPETVNRAMASPSGTRMSMVLAVDPSAYDAFVSGLETGRLSGATNAGVVISGTDVTVTPARQGDTVDREAFLADVQAAMSGNDATVEIRPVHGDPPITTVEAEEAAATVREMIGQPFVFELAGHQWQASEQQIAQAIVVSPLPTGTLDVSLDMSALESTLAGIIEEAESETVADAWVQDLGSHSWLVPSQSAMAIDEGELATGLTEALLAGRHHMEVPATAEQPSVTTEELASRLGITERIALGTSNFAGSGPGRYHNVETAAAMIDGTLVAPGGTYSFNDSVGSLFNGSYLDAGSYIDGPTGQSLAGGVCQVSTTVFRAALNAGFPIVEWYPHSYRTVYYEQGGWSPGFDASIVQDLGNPAASSDLKFVNPTDSWLLVRTSVDANGELSVELLGAPTGYEVTIEDPVSEVVEYASSSPMVLVDDQLPEGTMNDQAALDGLRVTVVRHVYDANGAWVSTDTFVSTYRAMQPIRRVSPDMEMAAYD